MDVVNWLARGSPIVEIIVVRAGECGRALPGGAHRPAAEATGRGIIAFAAAGAGVVRAGAARQHGRLGLGLWFGLVEEHSQWFCRLF